MYWTSKQNRNCLDLVLLSRHKKSVLCGHISKSIIALLLAPLKPKPYALYKLDY